MSNGRKSFPRHSLFRSITLVERSYLSPHLVPFSVLFLTITCIKCCSSVPSSQVCCDQLSGISFHGLGSNYRVSTATNCQVVASSHPYSQVRFSTCRSSFTQYLHASQLINTYTTYGHGSFNCRPYSPSKSWSSQSQSYTSTPSRSFLSPSPHSNTTGTSSRLESPYKSNETPTYSNT